MLDLMGKALFWGMSIQMVKFLIKSIVCTFILGITLAFFFSLGVSDVAQTALIAVIVLGTVFIFGYFFSLKAGGKLSRYNTIAEFFKILWGTVIAVACVGVALAAIHFSFLGGIWFGSILR